jgi:phage-related regulatory protein cII
MDYRSVFAFRCYTSSMTQAIAFFNNKGGVGKTTLACNFAAHIANTGRSVVVVDCDPQANATQLLLDETVWSEIYEDMDSSMQRTVLRVLRHIRAGDSGIDGDVELHPSPRFNVHVLAGHPSLSNIEDRLSTSWSEFRSAELGGVRRSLWARSLVKCIDADVIIFDLGPSLGALNRSVLMGSTFFVTPVAADLFSLYALENIGAWIDVWSGSYESDRKRINATSSELEEYDIPASLPIIHGWAGYSVQQYVAKTNAGQIRQVQAYDRYRSEIPERAEGLHKFKASNANAVDLGMVPNMFSMVPLAQNAHSPINDLTTADGVRGAQVNQQKRYVDQLNEVFSKLQANLSL